MIIVINKSLKKEKEKSIIYMHNMKHERMSVFFSSFFFGGGGGRGGRIKLMSNRSRSMRSTPRACSYFVRIFIEAESTSREINLFLCGCENILGCFPLNMF